MMFDVQVSDTLISMCDRSINIKQSILWHGYASMIFSSFEITTTKRKRHKLRIRGPEALVKEVFDD